MATFKKLSDLDSMTISDYNTGELLTTINSDTIMFSHVSAIKLNIWIKIAAGRYFFQ